ncbi:4-deoxy-4-formamido-L-arabinose-phosphoundecaprenol deformylase [uncultured Victivallis sp.]|uniref:4-deoxy-4-formamido-L-arabinose- phosphoundecaprenol deformylase n=1 Tax=uncultured Victivallis sp. TaxID=354118 RepID=UPI0025ED2513|nr:4-deoxy-4-formamido-L-arabinose-phosphoundecaprenol deformylase [uncultured Victivallis sp.]
MKTIALRIDVDTYRGTGRGVPRLCEILKKHGVRGTFYFSVGPDNMGRHLWRLLKPSFLWKMLRTDAAGLYGPEIILMGTAWPGPKIGKRFRPVIRETMDAGHEIGFHAWDHHKAQAKLMSMSEAEMADEIDRGLAFLAGVTGGIVHTSAAPGWRTNARLLEVKMRYPFKYNSDCRGTHPFYPVVNGKRLEQLQIPVTLPTYDEALGRDGVNDANYNDHQIGLLTEERPNVLTIHAEAEGGKCAAMFDAYLDRVKALGYEIIPLGELARRVKDSAPDGEMELREFPGREGVLAVQK